MPPGAAHRSSTRSPGCGRQRAGDQHRRARLRQKRAGAPQRGAVHVERPLEHERLGQHRGSACVGAPASSPRQRRGASATSVFARSATSPGSLSQAISARASSAPSSSPPQARDPLRVRVRDGGLLGRGVARAPLSSAADPSRAARRSTALTSPWPARGHWRLGELDGVGDDRVVGRAVQVQQLVQPEPQRRQQRRVQLARRGARRAARSGGRASPCAGPRRRRGASRARGRARRASRGLGVQRAVGVGAVLEDAAQHRVGADAGLSRACPRR